MKKLILLTAIGALCTQAQSQSWNVAGNAGTNGSTNFIGTTDNVAFKIRTKNAVRITVNGGGKVGIGTTSPIFKLDVKGGSINTDSVYRIGGNTVLSVKGTGNTFVGIGSGSSNTTGSLNTGTGAYALINNTTGVFNTANGGDALLTNTTGSYNTAVGADALYSNTTGVHNTACGNNALEFNTSGTENTALGMNSLVSNSTGGANTGVGFNSIYGNTTGSWITAIGYEALRSNTTGWYNTASGFQALYSNTTGSHNTATGLYSLFHNTTAVGNCAFGLSALYNNTVGNDNIAVGYEAHYYNADGSQNVAIGKQVLYNTTNSSNNVAVGFQAGAFGSFGWNNTLIGGSADASTSGLYNTVALGQVASVSAPNQARIGNSSTNSIGGYAGWSNLSDGRYKKNVQENVKGLEFILKLRPVTYNLDAWKLSEKLNEDRQLDATGKQIKITPDATTVQSRNEKSKIVYTGFIAQEVEKAANDLGYDFSGVDAPKNEQDLYALRYAEFVVPLVKAVQELSDELTQVKSLLTPVQQQKLNGIKYADKEQLVQNSPNPFSAKTIIQFNIPASVKNAEIKIYSSDGKELKSFVLSTTGQGQIEINANTFSSGIYSYTLFVDGIPMATRQMILTKP